MNTELLLPAGTLDKMRAAYDFGADAVYAGQPRYSLRARNNDFNNKTLKIGIDEAHARGKKLYDKRQDIAKKDQRREAERDFKVKNLY